MIVCHCRAVNDAAIRAAIAAGANDEIDVAVACKAGTDCGGCMPTITQLLDECRACPLDAPWSERVHSAVA